MPFLVATDEALMALNAPVLSLERVRSFGSLGHFGLFALGLLYFRSVRSPSLTNLVTIPTRSDN